MYSNEILLAEDDVNDASFFRRALGKLDDPPQLVWKTDAASVLQLLEEAKQKPHQPLPRLLIFDIKMPGMTGLELLEKVRQEPATKDIPVIVMSSSDDPSDISTAYEYGANSYIVKPDRFAELRELVESITQFWMKTNRLRPANNP